MAPVANIKGAAFREFVRWYAKGAPDRVADAAKRSALRLDNHKDSLGILTGTWYPAVEVHHFLDILLAGISPAHRSELARTGARVTIERTLSGFYKLLFSAMATPERYARNAQRLFSAYYDQGTIRVMSGRGEAVSRTTDWAAHHPFICEMHRHAAGFIYEAMGCVGVVTMRLECVATGGSACSVRTSWRRDDASV